MALAAVVRGGFPHAVIAGISGHPWAVALIGVAAACVAVGVWIPIAAGFLTLTLTLSASYGLVIGQEPLQEPMRAVMFAVIYAAIACARHDIDLGLLILRVGTGLSLFAFFGLTKIGWVIALAHEPGTWTTWGFARLIGAVGLPAAPVLALLAIGNETLTPICVALGVLARPAALIGAIGFAGALYTSLRIAEEPMRAALYLIAFATLTLTGAGRRALGHP